MPYDPYSIDVQDIIDSAMTTAEALYETRPAAIWGFAVTAYEAAVEAKQISNRVTLDDVESAMKIAYPLWEQ